MSRRQRVARRGVLLSMVAVTGLLAQPRAPAEEDLRRALGRDEVTSSLAWIEASEDRAVETLVGLASIVSPSGEEQERSRWLADRMRAIGLRDVAVDPLANVTGSIPGRSGRALVFVTILDDLATIEQLQREAERPPHRQGDRVVGPATEVQSVIAATLLAAEALVRSGVEPEHDVVIAAVAQEETGLHGMRALFETWRDRAVAWVEVLGDGSEIVYGAGWIHWWQVVAHGRGGHTAETGLPNVNLAISRAVQEILSLPHPERYDDTFVNVGILQSGEVYNHKPTSGWFSLDLRSMQSEVLADLEAAVEAVLDRIQEEVGIGFEMRSVMTIEGGRVPGAEDSRLLRLATAISRHLGYDPELSVEGCCNMSVPVSQGRLALGLHGERGGERATPGEWASVPAMIRTARHVALMAVSYGVTE